MNKMKGNAGRGKRIAAITAAILTFTGVATVNPYMVYAQDAAKSITITGNTTAIQETDSGKLYRMSVEKRIRRQEKIRLHLH